MLKIIHINLLIILLFYSGFVYSQYENLLGACVGAYSGVPQTTFSDCESRSRQDEPQQRKYIIDSTHIIYQIRPDSTNFAFTWRAPDGVNPQSVYDEFIEPPLLSCSSLGYDPTNGIYPSGFCVEGTYGYESSEESQCTQGEGTHDIPSCSLVTCPDGQVIDSITGNCKLPLSCWDGSVVFGDLTNCPASPFICSDGSQSPSQDQCAKPNIQNKVCHDGSTVPLDALCPTTANVTCSDGSSVPSSPLCPSPTTISHTCSDGSRVQNENQCSTPSIVATNVNDTASSTSTSTTIHNNTDGTTTTSTTTEQTELVINLDGVNSRLDQINETLEGFNEGDSGNGTSIYEKSGKTFGGATSAFMDAMNETAIVTGLADIFVIDIIQTTCPSWTLPAVWIFPSFAIDHHCQPFMENVFSLVSGVMILIATMIAVRISIVG